jgi:hypothetical protein
VSTWTLKVEEDFSTQGRANTRASALTTFLTSNAPVGTWAVRQAPGEKGTFVVTVNVFGLTDAQAPVLYAAVSGSSQRVSGRISLYEHLARNDGTANFVGVLTSEK